MQSLNLARACLESWATDPAHAGRPAFTFVTPEADETFTYAEVWERIQRVGRGLLASGLPPGERVLIRLPHSPDYAFAFLGATLAGLVPIPANPTLTAEEVAFLVEDAQAAAIVANPEAQVAGFPGVVIDQAALGRLDGPGPLPETASEDPAYLIYTSGSTARPKGVLHAHRTVLARRLMREGWQGFTPDDRTLHAGTLNWSYTLGVGLLDAWAAGAHAHLVQQPFDPSGWPALMERLGTTIFIAATTVYRQILKYGSLEARDLSALRYGLCAGEPLWPALLDEWRAVAGTELYESLGMTEISTYISSSETAPVRPGGAARRDPARVAGRTRAYRRCRGAARGARAPRRASVGSGTDARVLATAR